uniref:Uncharacterized protein n=1 Tax=Anguilla anguilla TaxID=7936 RepID=A0A0E9QGM2_ANGAN
MCHFSIFFTCKKLKIKPQPHEQSSPAPMYKHFFQLKYKSMLNISNTV